ncbi:exopolyphosphatase [Megamonas hypermegale]|uniref:Ppx/GppA phosphatase family protein n=1 Tax=Megamonas hypermegale TaxID=158847 RepID=UPI0019589BA8|nr:exopolyphosphatase [Megamonas hypermegale]MBM6833652.1 exopolyphosphatase [Megamonas hypermegale]HJG07062.1 exopolyphosphatase [Megamonas hypermegale]
MLYAVIDIGSTTMRMAIYQISQNKLELVHKRKYTVGLASYVQDGIMTPEGIDKACEILNKFHAFLTSFNIKNVSAFTTAALRNAKNSEEAVAKIIERTGINLHIISGDQEATYDFIAATHDLDYSEGFIVDIGGASTELIRFADSKILHKISLPIGSLALHTKYCTDFLPNEAEIAQMVAEARKIINDAEEFKNITHTEICGIGGTCKGARMLYNEMYHKPDSNDAIPVDKIPEIISHFTRGHEFSDEDITILLKTVPDRLHTIIPGLIIANELAKIVNAHSITYKDAGMREGFLYTHVIKD